MENKKHIVAVNAVIRNNNKILVVKRAKHEIAFPGKWAFPGGKVEVGQSIIDALKREVMEEVGIEIDDFKHFLKDFTFIRNDGHNVMGFCFLVNALNSEVKLDEKDFDDFKWVNLNELKELDHLEGMYEEAEKALDFNL